MKKFNLKDAKEGKPVCTREGKKARIICFDSVSDFPIIALVMTEFAGKSQEIVISTDNEGHLYKNIITYEDLMMK